VISEETGSISYAYKGILVRGVTAEEAARVPDFDPGEA
jgi:DNA integrity scanning protein DisA with diadenylate cyclase activity